MNDDFQASSLLEDGFSLPAARSLAATCKLAYETDAAAIEATLGDWGLELTVIFDFGGTQGFAAANEEIAILAFRGTESVGDWIRNLKIRRTEVPMGKVHRGFQGGLELVWSSHIEPALASLAGTGRKIWFTGHSLGAALAAAAAAKAHGSIEISGCYTYGQPLLGNDEFARNFNDAYGGRFFRLVNNRDIVTKIPPAPLYSHVDTRYQIDAEGTVAKAVRTRGFGAEPEAMDVAEFEALQAQLEIANAVETGDPSALPRGSLPHVKIQGIEDHDIENGYLRQLRKELG